MIKKKLGIVILALCLCLCLMPICAQADFASDALEPIIPDKECSLTISYAYGETALSGVQVGLYKIADVSADFKYTLTQAFDNSGLTLSGIKNEGEWEVIRSTLEAIIIAEGIDADRVASTDTNGQAFFDALGTGIYLATTAPITDGKHQYIFDSAIFLLPSLGQDGMWQYDVTVNPKGELLPPIDSDEEIELKVTKLWKNDNGKTGRPTSIDVEIFCDGESFKKVVLSKENNWSYSWSGKDDGSVWTVVERNVPKGYTMTVENKNSTFVLTNTYNTISPDGDPPKTGDTSNIMLYILLMTLSGIMLIILGVVRKRTN